MGCQRVLPEEEQVDLDMDSASLTADEVRRGLAILGDPSQTKVSLDSETDRMLAPFGTMFQLERIQRPFTWRHLLLLLYAPFGLLLLAIRIFLLFAIALTLPRFLSQERLDAMGFDALIASVTGTVVTLKDTKYWDRLHPASVVVSNHISEADAVAVRSVMRGYVLGYEFYRKMLFFRLFGDKLGILYVPYVSRTQGGAQGRDQVRNLIQEKLKDADRPLMAFPEGGLTNGKKGLLQYHSFLFSLGQRVQPLAIQVTDGPFPININDETSTFAANVLWYLFVPWHTYTVQFLPVTQAASDESALDFAHRVMKQTARALHQDATPFMYREKIAFTRYKTQQLHKQKK